MEICPWHIRFNKPANFHTPKFATSLRFAPLLTQEAAQILIQALVLPRLYYPDVLYYGKSDSLTQKLQVQNASARLGWSKYNHIKPALESLHWLPVRQHIEFKISLTYSRLWMDVHPLTSLVFWSSCCPLVPKYLTQNNCCLCLESDTNAFGDWPFSKQLRKYGTNSR